ncbi:MAG: hypothetical protein DKINENOH_01682 [bacterium]|nr:hypothetical protein [bacterium]
MPVEVVLAVIGVVFSILTLFGVTIHLEKRQTWAALRKAIAILEGDIRRYAPDVVVGVSDGLVPAAVICLNFDIPDCLFLNLPISRGRSGERTLPQISFDYDLHGKKVLIVDNHIYSGFNLKAAVDFIRSRDPQDVKTLVIYKHVYNNPAIQPNLSAYKVTKTIKKVPWSYTKDHVEAYLS